MRRSMFALGLVTILLASGAAARAQSDSPGTSLPKPGPEHEILRKDVGVWDATVELVMQPGGKPEITKGTETNTLIGGLWLVQDFKADMMGMPFHGHSITGYDVAKKKYVGTWVDSMSPGLSATEATIDPRTKIMTATIEGPCPEGTVMKTRATTEWKDDNTRVFTMYSPEDKGESFAMMKITYKRRSAH